MGFLSVYKDEQLLEMLRGGQEEAFTEIYRRYWRLLFSVATVKLDAPEVAEEVVNDVFVSLWVRREELSITYSLKAYLAGAVKFGVYKALA